MAVKKYTDKFGNKQYSKQEIMAYRKEIVRLNGEGKNDREVSIVLGVKYEFARAHRVEMKLPSRFNPKKKKDKSLLHTEEPEVPIVRPKPVPITGSLSFPALNQARQILGGKLKEQHGVFYLAGRKALLGDVLREAGVVRQ